VLVHLLDALEEAVAGPDVEEIEFVDAFAPQRLRRDEQPLRFFQRRLVAVVIENERGDAVGIAEGLLEDVGASADRVVGGDEQLPLDLLLPAGDRRRLRQPRTRPGSCRSSPRVRWPAAA
jgi:hypothetical protein